MTALPTWVDREAWEGFVEMRKRQEKLSRGKIAWTARAEKLVIVELYKLHDKGHDANRALDESALKGWTDVYCPKDKDIPNMKREYMTSLGPSMTEAEKARADEARKSIMLKRVA